MGEGAELVFSSYMVMFAFNLKAIVCVILFY